MKVAKLRFSFIFSASSLSVVLFLLYALLTAGTSASAHGFTAQTNTMQSVKWENNITYDRSVINYRRTGGNATAPLIVNSSVYELCRDIWRVNSTSWLICRVRSENLTIVPLSARAVEADYKTSEAGGTTAPLPWWILAVGSAGVLTYIYGLYMSLACKGALCKWNRFKALLPLSIATILTSIAMSWQSPLFSALLAPGVWTAWRYYSIKRRLRIWLNTTLT
ncbi:hypothetical protein [Pyrobaculum aerophilum]|uniref:hypothetical protein n=1 Tax=Pyrobaculum aerophilum TaxID=13773 RepID=UPI0023F27ADB|nr:hypothetical protein [Pyrobaculum aerophilum]MCX8135907.1 hypothetical protein [Pyrobaculum aerophilum]